MGGFNAEEGVEQRSGIEACFQQRGRVQIRAPVSGSLWGSNEETRGPQETGL